MNITESSEELAARRERIKARQEHQCAQQAVKRARAEKNIALLKRKIFPIWLFALIFVAICLLVIPYFFANLGGVGLFLPWFIMAVLSIIGIGLKLYVNHIKKDLFKDEEKANSILEN